MKRSSRPAAAAVPTRIGLAGLEAGPLRRRLRLTGSAVGLGELPLRFERVEVDVEVRRAGGDAVRARGTLGARADAECRRCLAPARVEVEGEWEALFRPPARIPPGEDGVWALDAEARELDVAGPVREELWVRAPRYVECSAACPGMCATCGARLAEERCACPPPAPDPRWGALEGLRG